MSIDTALDRYFDAWNSHEPGHYLGTCFATVGPRNYTFTAWTSPEAAQEALRGEAHTSAMKLAQTGGIGAGARGVTSAWTPHFLNGVFRPGAASADLTELGGQWL